MPPDLRCRLCGWDGSHAPGCPEKVREPRPAREVCLTCRRPLIRLRFWRRDDGEPVCSDCIAGYRMCPHGYIQRGICLDCSGREP